MVFVKVPLWEIGENSWGCSTAVRATRRITENTVVHFTVFYPSKIGEHVRYFGIESEAIEYIKNVDASKIYKENRRLPKPSF